MMARLMLLLLSFQILLKFYRRVQRLLIRCHIRMSALRFLVLRCRLLIVQYSARLIMMAILFMSVLMRILLLASVVLMRPLILWVIVFYGRLMLLRALWWSLLIFLTFRGVRYRIILSKLSSLS